MLRVMVPAMGPTEEWWWLGSSAMAPEASSRSASTGSAAQPSKRHMPMAAPRWAPHMRSQVTGGPEWRMRRSRMPGITSPAGATSTRTGSAAVIRLKASSLAASMRSLRVMAYLTFPTTPSTYQFMLPIWSAPTLALGGRTMAPVLLFRGPVKGL